MKRISNKIKVGNVFIGGDSPITVQSMTTTNTENIEETINQIYALTVAGCEIVRSSAPTIEAAKALKYIKKEITIPIIADIHFDYKIAIEALNSGVDGLRLNPGNIGSIEKITKVVNLAKDKNIPIRIGVNGGSLEKDLLKKYGSATPEAMVESALRHVKILEDLNFYNTKISLKASDISRTVEAYRLIAKQVDYPLHLGITESGTLYNGTIKSSIGLGILLYDGIGDTIRVSLTADPVEEVKAGIAILKNLGIRKSGVTFVSCPTCSRAESDVIEIANKVEEKLSDIKKDIRVAVMGCIVNGPGEARDSDWAIVSNKDKASIYKSGKFLKSVPKTTLINDFITLVKE
jgi:(E)-4-hydroxy-3-methylbut-2-enyl-diphosphate synthase